MSPKSILSLPGKHFQAVVQKGEIQIERAQWSPRVVDVELEVWGSQDSWSSHRRVLERREVHAESTLEICIGSSLNIQLNG